MRRTLMAFLGIMILFLTATSFAGVCGDANGDGTCNLGDAGFIINYVFFDGPVPDPIESGEANGDDAVNLGDAGYIINYIFYDGPGPDCGTGTVTDIDGNVYQTVMIGTQVWMMENLKVTHYRNSDPIPNVTDNGTWEDLTTGAYCDYNNDVNNVATYGRLYNWHAVDDSRNIAPAGWHVPSDAEWKQLEMFLGMSQAEADNTSWRGTDEGGKLKETGTTHWASPNTGATNESGFTALPAGCRYYDGIFDSIGFITFFWTFTEYYSYYAWYRHLYFFSSEVFRDAYDKQNGFSVRCVRD